MLNNYTKPTHLQWGAEVPPINKMGVTVSKPHWDADADLPWVADSSNPVPYMHMITTSSGPKPVQCRLPADNEVAVVDWVNFTVGIETLGDKFYVSGADLSETDDVWMNAIFEFEHHLEHIFGFGITSQNQTGRNFYKQSYVLGDKMGVVCVGGQRNTILVMLSGKGCSFAKEGWEKRLYTFLTVMAKRPKLTRIDLAHDDFDGTRINVDWANYQDDLGGFTCNNNPPNVEHKGNWKRPNGRGRTLNIGSRESGKYLRVYEKGRAEGDPDDEWQRAEVEFKSSDGVLPFDMLLSPTEYFIASYPCFAFLAQHKQPTRIQTIKKTAVINFESALATLKHQYGKYINIFKEIFEPEELISKISCSDPLAYPERLDHCLTAARRM